MLCLQLHVLLELACLLVNAVELILKVKWLTLQLYVRHYRTMTKVVNLQYDTINIFVIPHLEICACDWSKSRHVVVNKSR